jgi:hypothetical protein
VIGERDWVELVKLDLENRMASYGGNAVGEFTILGLVQDPLVGLVERLASNVNSLLWVEDLLGANAQDPENTYNGTSDDDAVENAIRTADASYGLKVEILEHAMLPSNLKEELGIYSETQLRAKLGEIARSQVELRMMIKQEQEGNMSDEEKYTGRIYDYGPLIYEWLEFHRQNSAIKTIVDTIIN